MGRRAKYTFEQKHFHGKTAYQVRQEALAADKPTISNCTKQKNRTILLKDSKEQRKTPGASTTIKKQGQI